VCRYVNWAAEEEALILLKSGHVGSVMAVEASPHQPVFGSCGADGSFRLWSLEGARDEVFKFSTEDDIACTCLSFSPCDELVAVGFADGAVRLFCATLGGDAAEAVLYWRPEECAVR